MVYQSAIDKAALDLYKKDPKLAKEYLTEYCTNNANDVLEKWWDLGYYLIAKYNDGYINLPVMDKEVGYPKERLKKVGYDKGPISYAKQKKKRVWKKGLERLAIKLNF